MRRTTNKFSCNQQDAKHIVDKKSIKISDDECRFYENHIYFSETSWSIVISW